MRTRITTRRRPRAAVRSGKCLHGIRLDAGLDPPISEKHIVMGGVRLTDPLEQSLLDNSFIEVLGVDPLRTMSDELFAELDRLYRTTDKLYVHIDMDVLDPAEVEFHGNAVPDGVSSEQLARLFEEIFERYDKASAIGFATIPSEDPEGLALAAVHRMILGAVNGLKARVLVEFDGVSLVQRARQVMFRIARPSLAV
jgi:arginase family enzyme